MSTNLLNISWRGVDGIETGNLIHQALHQSEKQYDAKYDYLNTKIVVLKSSDLEIDTLQKMLYGEEFNLKYNGWFPKISKKRDKDGNLLIKLVQLHPDYSSLQNYRFAQSLRRLQLLGEYYVSRLTESEGLS